MATGSRPNDGFDRDTGDIYREIFSLIWLDPNVNVKGTQDTEQKLRSIINHLKKFEDVKQCEQYIKQRSKTDRLVLIVHGRLANEIISSIYKLRQVISIYVYSMDKKTNEQWDSRFCKSKTMLQKFCLFLLFFLQVRPVAIDLDGLICQLKKDYKVRKRLEEPLSINVFKTSTDASTSVTTDAGKAVTTNAGKSLRDVNGQFVFFSNSH